MKQLEHASVIIITKNRSSQLLKCLRSLSRQTTKPSEVIVIDSSDVQQRPRPQDNSLSLVYRYAPQYSIPAARQLGLDTAKYSLALFLDDDCTAERNWLKKMTDLSTKYPNACLIAGSLIHMPSGSLYAQIIKDIRRQRIRSAGDCHFLYFNIENCLIRKRFIRKHNIKFDEFLYHEDFADFALQVKLAGGKIFISNQTKVYHHERQNLRSFLRQRFKNSGNFARLKIKWPDQKFHFFASSRSGFLPILIYRIREYLMKCQIINTIKYLAIVILSVITYELGSCHSRLANSRDLNRTYLNIKSILDLSLAVILLIFSIPAMLLIGFIIAIDSPGPIIFSQPRLGKDLKLFKFYKFRTMWSDAKQRYPNLYDYRLSPHQLDIYKFKTAEDPRLTRFGRYLRRTSLDELPNLINVIKGDMSLVGPRPEIPPMLPYYSQEERTKFSVKPGITGYAQIKGRGLLTFKQTIKYDLRYIHDRGLVFDLQIIIWTIAVVLRGLGAF